MLFITTVTLRAMRHTCGHIPSCAFTINQHLHLSIPFYYKRRSPFTTKVPEFGRYLASGHVSHIPVTTDVTTDVGCCKRRCFTLWQSHRTQFTSSLSPSHAAKSYAFTYAVRSCLSSASWTGYSCKQLRLTGPLILRPNPACFKFITAEHMECLLQF